MYIYEKFIVNPEGLPEVMSAILQQEIPEQFSSEYLMKLGIDEPNSTLYISLFQNLGMVDSKEVPTAEFEQFHRSEEAAGRVIAEQMKNRTYSALFQADEHIHRLKEKEIRKRFQNLMGEKKSVTFVRLVTDTFLALSRFANWDPKETPAEQPAGRETLPEAVVTGAPDERNPESPLPAYLNGRGVKVGRPAAALQAERQEAESPHEEFILELMYESDEHPYTCHTFRTERSDRSEIDANELVKENGMSNGNSMGTENGMSHENGMSTENGMSNGNGKEKEKENQSTGGNGTFISLPKQPAGVPDQQVLFLKAMIRRAALLKQMERMQEAVGAYNEIIRYFESRRYLMDRDNLINAYYNKAFLLEQMEQHEEALEIYEHLITCFSSTTN